MKNMTIVLLLLIIGIMCPVHYMQYEHTKTYKKDLNHYKSMYEKLSISDRDKLAHYIPNKYTNITHEAARELADATYKMCKKHNFPFSIAVGMMDVESQFNVTAVSPAKARGPLQVMFLIWKDELGLKSPKQLHDPEIGVESGILVIKHYLDLEENNNDFEKALRCYLSKKAKKKDWYEYRLNVYRSAIEFNLYTIN